MKKFFLYGSGIILIALIVIAILVPKSETVERSITIKKPITEVYTYFALLQNMEEWSPWAKKDPATVHTYQGEGNTVGSIHFWNSTHEQVGVGEQEITSMVPNKEIYSDLRFKEPFESTSVGYLKFQDKGNQTQVTWGYNAKYNPVEAIFMSLMDMDKYIGADFEAGLSNAKTILEK